MFLKVDSDALEQVVESVHAEHDQQFQRMIENAIFIDLEHIFQEQSEVLVVKHNQLIDGLEKLSEGVLEPHLQLSLLQGFGLGSVGDFLESWPEDALQHHLPELILE